MVLGERGAGLEMRILTLDILSEKGLCYSRDKRSGALEEPALLLVNP